MKMEKKNTKARKNRTTPTDEFKHSEVEHWWGTSVPRGVAILLRRIADEVIRGHVTGLSFKWSGEDVVDFVVNELDKEKRVHLDARVYDTGVYEMNDKEEAPEDINRWERKF